MSSSDESNPSDEAASLVQFVNFFSILGYATSQWGHVDFKLFDFFLFCLGIDEKKAAAIFYSWQNIGQRLNVVDKLMQSSLSAKQLKQWKKINKAIDTELATRNHLAHDPYTYRPFEDYNLADFLQQKPPRPRPDPYEIVTATPKLLVRKGSDLRRSRFADINKHAKAVELILKHMEAFRLTLPERARKQRAAHPRPSALPKKALKKSGRRTSAKRKRPLQSSPQ
jgi:hypothetical protein